MSTRKAVRVVKIKRKIGRKTRKFVPHISIQGHSAGSIRRPLSTFADEMFTVLRYCEQITYTPSATVCSTNTFSANGAYDPNVTGTGHQPFGFDQLCSASGPYNRYSVLRARAHLTLYCGAIDSGSTVNNQGGVFVMINLRRELTSDFTTVQSNVEDVSCKAYALATQYQCKTIRTPWIDLGAYFGIAPKVYGSQVDFSGTFSANPSVQAYIITAVGTTMQATNNPEDMFGTILIEYECRFWSQNQSVVSVKELDDELKDLRLQVARLSSSRGPMPIGTKSLAHDEDYMNL
jgi:hypothetical protein